MIETVFSGDRRYPELLLREFETADESWFPDPDGTPEHVLELIAPDREPRRWPFHASVDAIAGFSMHWQEELGDARYRSDRFDEDADRRLKRLRDVMLASFSFLDTALEGDIHAFATALEDIPEGTPVIVDTGHDVTPDFPWAMLHPWPVPSVTALSIDGLLGARFQLVRRAAPSPGGLAAGGGALDVFANVGRGSYGFVDDDKLPSVNLRIERDAIAAHVGDSFDPLHAGGIHGRETLERHEDLISYLLTSRTALHFSCHGGCGSGKAKGRYHIRVRQQQNVDLAWLKRRIEERRAPDIGSIRGASNKLIFLNICGSMVRSRRQDRSAAAAFEKLRPEAMIGTQGAVCDVLAARFAAKFYEESLVNRQSVGASFLTAVRDGLAKTHNPAHLLFQLKGEPDVHIG